MDISNLDPKIALKLFNAFIKPILLYGAEIWGPETLCRNNLQKTLSRFVKFENETILLSFARGVLKVHRNAHNLGVRGELGLYPLAIDIMDYVHRFKTHIMDSCPSSLLKNAFNEGMKNTSMSTWLSATQAQNNILMLPDTAVASEIVSKYKDMFVNYWKESLSDVNSKLRFYALLKSSFVYEPYLSVVKNSDHRSALTKMRISAHNLSIETGRYLTPKMPINERICRLCNSVEDEIHFVTCCRGLNNERMALYTTVSSECQNFMQLPDNYKCIYLLNSSDVISKETGKFLYNALEQRKGWL